MANVNFDTAVSGGGVNSPIAKTWTHTCAVPPSGGNTVLFVAVNIDGTDTGVTTSATYNGVAMTALGGKIEAFTGGGGFLQLYYMLSAPTGANTVSISASSVPSDMNGVSMSFVPGTGFGLTVGTPVTGGPRFCCAVPHQHRHH